jgi:hypothetical protein
MKHYVHICMVRTSKMYVCTPFVTAGPVLGSEQEQLWYFSHYCHESYRGTEERYNYGKCKTILLQAWTGLDRPLGFQEVEASRYPDNRRMKVTWPSVLRTGRLYPPGNFPGTHFCSRLSRPQGHCAAGRIMSMKNLNDPIGNRTCHLPTAPPRTPQLYSYD